MQFRDLKKQYEVLKKDIDQAMLEVAASGAFIMETSEKNWNSSWHNMSA
jgi:chemotaxis methyl-accepting protein methylase